MAALAYGAFLAWYTNWRGPLRPEEIDRFLELTVATPGAAHNDLAIIREFLEHDDGREFMMLNVVKIAEGEAAHPDSGQMQPAPKLMRHYMRSFLPLVLRHGGHPAIAARKIGGYVDAWNVAPDPGWTLMGWVRYRSRRDMMELVVDPGFSRLHPFKIVGTAQTFSFPTRPMLTLFAGPRVWVALVVALVAALAQICALLQS
jgi:hypothetical protein